MAYLGRFPGEQGKKQAQRYLLKMVRHDKNNVEQAWKKSNGYLEELQK